MRIPAIPPHQPSHPLHGPGMVGDVPTDNAYQLGRLSDALWGSIRNYEVHYDAVSLEALMKACHALCLFLDTKPTFPDSLKDQAAALYSEMQKPVIPWIPLLNQSLDKCCQAYLGSAADCQAMVTALIALGSQGADCQDPFGLSKDNGLYLTLCTYRDDKTLPFVDRNNANIQNEVDELRDDIDALHNALLTDPQDTTSITALTAEIAETIQNLNTDCYNPVMVQDGYLVALYSFLNTPTTVGDSDTSLLRLAQQEPGAGYQPLLAALKGLGIGNPIIKAKDDFRLLLDTVRKYEFQETDVPPYI